MSRTSLILLLTASFCLSAQKITLTDIDNSQKKAAVDAQANKKQAEQDHAELNAVGRQIASEQNKAAKLAAQRLDSSQLADYKREERLERIESTLTSLQEQKAAEDAAQARLHDEYLTLGRDVLAGLIVALILGAIGVYRQNRRHKAEEAARVEARRAVEQSQENFYTIRGLVNGTLTASKQGEADALLVAVAALRKLAASGDAGEHLAEIAAAEKRIAELQTELRERLKQHK